MTMTCQALETAKISMNVILTTMLFVKSSEVEQTEIDFIVHSSVSWLSGHDKGSAYGIEIT